MRIKEQVRIHQAGKEEGECLLLLKPLVYTPKFRMFPKHSLHSNYLLVGASNTYKSFNKKNLDQKPIKENEGIKRK